MTIYDFKVRARKGAEFDLATLRGKVTLIVNTATGCGFTPQYKGLEELYEKYHDKGFEILDFPCNQFGNQAPGNEEEIHEFCALKYDTQFDQLAKIEVNGENEEPLYTYLKEALPTEDPRGLGKMIMKKIAKISDSVTKESDIKWNFTKFLIDREGKVVGRYPPTTSPKDIEEDVVLLL